LARTAPGLFWVSVLFSGLLAGQRSFSLESADNARDGLRLSGLDPAGIFLGKAGAIVVQMLALEVILAGFVTLMHGRHLHGPAILIITCVAATAGMAASG